MLNTSWIAMALVAGMTMTVGSFALTGGHGSARAATSAGQAEHSYRQAVLSLDEYIDSLEQRAKQDPRSWLVPGSLCQAYRERAILTGDYIDFSRAQEALDRSFAIAPHGAGPFLARAQLNASMHRWDRIEPDLIKVESSCPKSFESAAVTALRAERDFQSGRYDDALSGYKKALLLDENGNRYFSLADAYNSVGDLHQCDALLEKGEHLVSRREYVSRAWLLLQHGFILQERGRLDEAQQYYERADATMPGWWRVLGREADVMVLLGHSTEAVERYEQLVKQTGNPEFMDDLARLAAIRKDDKNRAHWVDMSRVVYQGEIQDFPEAASAHALDHYLDLENDPAVSLRLAEMNHALRPGGEASCKLARALLQAGMISQARALIDAVLADRWDAPLLHRTASEIYKASGDLPRAQAEEVLAKRIR